MDENIDFLYACKDEKNIGCSQSCNSLVECSSCECVVQTLDASGGPWGDVGDVILCLLPIFFLVFVTLKKNPLPTTTSLPVAAFILWWIRLAYLSSDVIQTCAAVVLGLHEAITPITIMAGAIFLFETMEATLCLPYMMREMKILTAGHPVAELMLIFCFATLVEGASGFGTPVALGAPMLVSTGNPALGSVVVLLLMNTFATIWGAVGTPIWFGFGDLGLSERDLTLVSQNAGVAIGICAFLFLPLVLTVIVPFKIVRQNALFIYLSLLTCVGAQVGIAMVDYQFPSLAGGLIGCLATAFLISYKVGLKAIDNPTETFGRDISSIGGVSESSLVRSYHKFSQSSEVVSDSVLKVADAVDTERNIKLDPTVSDEEIVRSSDSNNGMEYEIVDNTTVPAEPIEEAAHEEQMKGDLDNEEVECSGAVAIVENDTEGEALAKFVEEKLGPRKTIKEGYIKESLMRTFPIWGTVALLILTRVDEIGLKEYLMLREPYFQISFGHYGVFRLSASLVFQLRDILTYPAMNWRYELLYTPFIMPFVIISTITMILYRSDMKASNVRPMDIVLVVVRRLIKPFMALLGALVLVQLMIRKGASAPAFLIGSILADWFKGGFVVISPLLGALGSFFSGSTTVSNLTFGDIQVLAAETLGVSKHAMLALQIVGASAGNGICLNNIIAGCAVVGLTDVGEGAILMKTCKIVFTTTTMATIIMIAFFIRF